MGRGRVVEVSCRSPQLIRAGAFSFKRDCSVGCDLWTGAARPQAKPSLKLCPYRFWIAARLESYFHCARDGHWNERRRPPPPTQLRGARIAKEYCNIDCPGLGHQQHFFSGVALEICETDPDLPGEFLDQVVLKFVADRKTDATHWIAMNLTSMQEQIDNPAIDWRVAISQAITDAIALEEKELGRYCRTC